MARLIDVAGASNGDGGTLPATSRLCRLRPRAACTVRDTVRTSASAWAGSDPSTPRHRSTSLGRGSRRPPRVVAGRPLRGPSRPGLRPGVTAGPAHLAGAHRSSEQRMRPGLGREVEERRQHLRTRHPVDDRVVHFRHQGQVPVGKPLDHMELPQGPLAVERPRGDVSHQLGQLVETTGFGQAHPAHVVVDVEVGIVDHRRVLQPERHLHDPLAEGRDQVQAVGHHVADPPEINPSVDPGRVEDQRSEDVEVDGGRLEREKGPVEAGQPLHPYRPVEPKPSRPRSLAGSRSTSTKCARSTRLITSWAMRSPRRTS